ncbi:MAG: hypothetical protein CL678_12980 [Bdellovibrionaceae bacterium]|nr:hypothetical protein [Pseudobdellovibrionaceae bacterium]|tara:strand:+ start:7286 stop:7600 length:315 start_codon:yes stop_codon:yes gene_type:complete
MGIRWLGVLFLFLLNSSVQSFIYEKETSSFGTVVGTSSVSAIEVNQMTPVSEEEETGSFQNFLLADPYIFHLYHFESSTSLAREVVGLMSIHIQYQVRAPPLFV